MKFLKRILLFIMILSLAAMAFLPFAQDENPWRNIFTTVIGLIAMLLGAPVTQWLKNVLKVKDKLAVLLTGLVAVILAFAELFLLGMLGLESFTLENFPAAFTAVFTVATFYYHLLKDVDNGLGANGLLKVS